MRLLPVVILASLASCSVFGQNYTISTFAGGGLPVNVLGTSAGLGLVGGVAVDSAGNVFITSSVYNVVLRLDAKTGVLSLVAGTGGAGFGGDNGPATGAQLNGPEGIAVDSAGNLYIADTYNNRIREVSNGVITTVAGGLSNPNGVAVDSAGNLYIADTFNSCIRKVSNGVIATVAGNGTQGFSGDNGPANSAELYYPEGVAVDSAGNLYIADTFNSCIRKVSNGVIATVAGNGTQGFSGDNGPANSAQLYSPYGVAVDSAGNLYIADLANSIRKVSNGVITTVAGNGACGFSGDNGHATSAQLCEPQGDAVDTAGNLYIADTFNDRIRKVSNGVIATIAGGGSSSLGATSAQLYYPDGCAVDTAGNLYIADTFNNVIRKVSNGVITTVAGNGTSGFKGDNGPANSAELSYPGGVAVDSAGNIYIADTDNDRIRKVSNGVITTVAGNGTPGFSGDNGPATSAQLIAPYGVAVDSAGNLYIAEGGNNRVRKVSNGVITTVAGNGTQGFSGDNGPATSAELYFPEGVAVDSFGNLYIADAANNRIRKVSNGVITTVAGGGTSGLGDNGPATGAQLSTPYGVAVDSAGSLYIADYFNNRVRKVSNGVITTVAGNGADGFSGDNGPATSAELLLPKGVAVDTAGNVYIADTFNNRIRLLTPSGATAPSLSITAVDNAASNLSGMIAPGEIVVLVGSGLGPAQLTSAHIGSDGLYDGQLVGTGVQINGIAAPMIYTSGTQVAAIVPYEVTGPSAQVTVSYQGQTSAPVTVAVGASAPGLFTLGSTGQGQAAAINQSGSINTSSTPAPIGSIISLYATGEGQTSPAGVDGKLAAMPVPTPILPVNVTIGGATVSDLQYVGGAPGEVAGLLQINVAIPAGITPGTAVPVEIRVGGATSQPGVSIAVSAN